MSVTDPTPDAGGCDVHGASWPAASGPVVHSDAPPVAGAGEAALVHALGKLALAAEYREDPTGLHVRRVAAFSRAVALQLGMTRAQADQLFLAAPLHDVGKIGVPDRILRKPGKLNEEEWSLMRRHCQIGRELLLSDEAICAPGSDAPPPSEASLGAHPVFELAADIAWSHHEKWDGSGYPRGCAGRQIPLAARIVAIADVYDSLRCARPYKPSFTLERTIEVLEQGDGKHFDPDVLQAFLDTLDEVREVERALNERLHAARESTDDSHPLR